MAQGRMLKKRISKSRKFAALKTHNARLLYLMIYPHLDIEGRIEANPTLLKADVAPLLNFSERKILEYLEDMHRVGLVVLYQVDGDLYLECVRFKDFQSLRADKEAESDIPGLSTGQVRELDGTAPALSKDKLKLSKVKTSKVQYSVCFEKFWKAYPKRFIPESNRWVKVGKYDAWDRWKKLTETEQQTIMSVIHNVKPGRAVPDAHRWLKGRRWEDYETPAEYKPAEGLPQPQMKTVAEPQDLGERINKQKDGLGVK